MLPSKILLSVLAALTAAHQHHDLVDKESKHEPSLEEIWGQEWTFTGSLSYAKLPYTKCLTSPNETYDIAIFGMPFDTAVSYRPGARFGPRALRIGSSRQTQGQGYNFRAGVNPFEDWAKVIDCGDVPVSPMDNGVAEKQMNLGYGQLLDHETVTGDGKPRLIMLGGDHSVILPALRNLYKEYGKINVIHFDSHLDSWSPEKYSSYWRSSQSDFTHGSMLWIAHQEGLLTDKNVHVGIRSRLTGQKDYDSDDSQGWLRIHADDILDIGLNGIVDQILGRIPADEAVYISVDIDVLDPAFAPGTGTIEPGGLMTRELIRIIRKLEGLNLVGADLVEVSPSYDNAEITATAGAQVVYEILTNMVKKGPLRGLKRHDDTPEDPTVLKMIEGLLNQGTM